MLAGYVLLGIAVAALAGAGWRLGGLLTAAPLERAVVAAVVAGVAAVAEALLLGRVGEAGTPLVLTATAVAAWLAARLAVPARAAPAWWSALGTGERAALGAVCGALLALVAWMLRHPAIGVDGLTYHLPEAIAWVQHGDTGATPASAPVFHSESFPLTNEVVLAWGMGIAHAFGPVALWMGAVVGLVALGGWVGLRRLGCGPLVTALAIAALLAEPVLVGQLNTPKNDLPALAWLIACGALCACAAPRVEHAAGAAAARPALLAPALAAAGLAIGSKTTTVPLAVIALAAGAWACRGALRTAAAPLAVGAVAALGVGGVWYLRNQIAHGWLLWPFGSGPFGGDPEPFSLRRIDVSFLDRPGRTLDGRAGDYVRTIAGGLVLAAGGVLAAALRPRSRLVVGTAAATAIAALAWLTAPFTGRADDPVLDLSLTTTRYLLPVFAAGAGALALAGRTSRLTRAALVAALVWNLVLALRLPYPQMPAPGWLVAGAAAGGAACWWAARRARVPVLAGSVAALLLAVGLSSGYARHAAETGATASAPLQAFFATRPGWDAGTEPVAFWPYMVATVAGDRLRHPVVLVPEGEGCPAIRARARRGWVAVRALAPAITALVPGNAAPRCLAGRPVVARVDGWLLYRQTATRSSARSRSASSSRKSSTPMAAARGSSRRRNSVSSTS